MISARGVGTGLHVALRKGVHDARERHLFIFHRLTHHFKHPTAKFGELIQEEKK
jgi:hypothetical protein